MIDKALNAIEVRVLGSLIEKQITTPEYYPLTLNALTTACNQKNNRDPITSLDEPTVVRALDGLREKKLTGTMTGAGIRVPKYKHHFVEVFKFTQQETSIMCVLMLRGSQTIGELRSRSGPLYTFNSIEEVEAVVAALNSRTPSPAVMKLPRQPGHKESRYTHLLSGTPEIKETDIAPPPEQARLQVITENERISKLEGQVKSLEHLIKELQKQFSSFKKQFE